MMLENGYIKFVKKSSSINENGNPVSDEEELTDFIPANYQGTTAKHLQSDSSNYEKQSYSVYVDFKSEMFQDNIILYDSQKNEIGKFQVKSKERQFLFNSYILTI